MKTGGEGPSPAFSVLDDILRDYWPGDSVSEVSRPVERVKVKKRGNALAGLKGLFSTKRKTEEPNCAQDKNVQVSGSSVGTMLINCEGCRFSSDLADPECRYRCVLLLGREPCANLVLDDGFYKREYGGSDTKKLKELYDISEGLSIKYPDVCGACAEEHEEQVRKVKEAMQRDPIKLLNGGVEVCENDEMRVSGVDKGVCRECARRTEQAVYKTLTKLRESSIVSGYDFRPLVRPFFSNSKILFEIPDRNKVEAAYDNNGAKVILSRGVEEMYSIFPPEYKSNRQKLEVMKAAYSSLIKNARDRKSFKSNCRSEIIKAASCRGYDFTNEEVDSMAENLVRCTEGLDVIELLLKDPNLQDVYINSPIDTTPLYVKHADFDDCRTNVYLSEQTARNIISKFRLRSGRAFSEISPMLDMELPEFGVRVNITGPPISPDGLAFAFRRASEEPWTLLRFIENRMISPMAAGLLGLIVNEESTVLICGDRGSGKTSMLTAMMGAMPIKYRILTMEDTFEIPVPMFAKHGFRIQRMRIKPSTAGDSFEVGADDAMRSLLRMGDSAIVIGEVRGQEARTLYEAMNVGGSGNCVLGTIHGKSPRSLLERVVFSLGVPPQSFKATDLVVIADRIRPGGGSVKLRRISEIVEVGKRWAEPEADKVFKKLMAYDRDSDMLKPADTLKAPEKSEVVCKIAGKRGVKPKTILEDIEARAEAYEHAVELYKNGRRPQNFKLLSLSAMIGLNQRYLQLVDESILDSGKPDYGFVLDGVKGWLEEYSRSGGQSGLPKTVQGIAV